jgi:hypothetical protein
LSRKSSNKYQSETWATLPTPNINDQLTEITFPITIWRYKELWKIVPPRKTLPRPFFERQGAGSVHKKWKNRAGAWDDSFSDHWSAWHNFSEVVSDHTTCRICKTLLARRRRMEIRCNVTKNYIIFYPINRLFLSRT